MKLEWLRGEEPSEHDKIKNMLLNDTFTLDKLKKLCYTYIQEIESASIRDYDSPSWAYKQAHENGEKAAYLRIIELCTMKSK